MKKVVTPSHDRSHDRSPSGAGRSLGPPGSVSESCFEEIADSADDRSVENETETETETETRSLRGLDDFPLAVASTHVGEEGFVAFLSELRQLTVFDREEHLAWLALHGAVLRMVEVPLDRGGGIDEATFVALEHELGR